jgi:hypothetical protein
MRRGILIVLLSGALLGVGGAVPVIRGRLDACKAVPVLAGELLHNASLLPGGASGLPEGWGRAAGGVELRGPAVDGEGFDLDGDGRALQLIGIANYVETPPSTVRPGGTYCFSGRALTDSEKGSQTRLRVVFNWRDSQGRTLAEDASGWQEVVLWRPEAPPAEWSSIGAAFQAPAGAATLAVRLQPASDDRVYLDAMHIRSGGRLEIGDWRLGANPQSPISNPQSPISVAPWPNGARGALSFSFDWETSMGGLIHSLRDDPQNGSALSRGLRMREGITTTLSLFRPHGIRATYYANGYNFLFGNTERRQFMGNPTFAWADDTPPHRWPNDHWATTPWFADDPYGTVQSHPAWYFGDLVPLLLREGQDIQSHTFSHLYGGFASVEEWRADLREWGAVAAERGVPPARSLAFPWSGSAGMSDDDWRALEQAGITSVTRTSGYAQYRLVSAERPHCAPVPGHERILACPDFYLHDAETAAQALKLIDRAVEAGGMIDLWAHTEEVVTPEQIAAWGQVVEYAARQRDAGALWIAPLVEIAGWQQAITQVRTENREPRTKNQGSENQLSFAVINESQRDLQGVTVLLPPEIERVTVNGEDSGSRFSVLGSALVLNIQAGETLEVLAWPA